MANSETYGRTSYFRVIEGKEAEFIEFIRSLSAEESYEIIVDSNTKPENLPPPPKGEMGTCSQGFALIDCGNLTCFAEDDEDCDEEIDVLAEIAERFLRPGSGIIHSYTSREKMRYVTGSTTLVLKHPDGSLSREDVSTWSAYRDWVSKHGDSFELTLPEY